MTIGSVILLPATPPSLNPNPQVSEADRRALAAELMAYGINLHRVPAVPETDEELDARTAIAHWVAHIAMNLTAEQPERPVLLVAFGSGGPMLPALGFSQKASRRPVAGYVVIDDDLPRAGSADWPDAPVTFVSTGENHRDEAHQAELRGWTTEKDADPAAVIRAIATE